MTTRTGAPLKASRRIVVLVVMAFAVAAAIPTVAAAAKTAFVSNAPVKGPFNSCATPGYNSIQEAAKTEPSHTTIHVCVGTYVEQARIEKAVSIVADSGATLKLPGSPANSTTTCDVQEPTKDEQQDLLTICGAGKVNISGLTLEGKWIAPACAKDLNGIMVGGNSSLNLSGSKILYAGSEPVSCGQGIGIQVGRNKIGQIGSVKLSNDLIEGYGKNGITVDGPGSKASIKEVTIKTVPTSVQAQNGIQVSRGAVAKISGVTIEGNECNAGSCGPNASINKFKGPEEWEEAEDATAILFYEAAGGSSVKTSKLTGNDIGVYNMTNAATAKTTLTGNTLKGNRYWGIALDEGSATVNNNTISGPGLVGIQIVQYAINEQFHEPARGQAFGAAGTGKADTISGMTQCAVEGLSDNEPGDKAGSLTLTKSLSKFSSNKTELCNNEVNNKLTISVS